LIHFAKHFAKSGSKWLTGGCADGGARRGGGMFGQALTE
jgi:hypothetical protein